MLRLEKLEIAGFKSFSDRTVATFKPGITAVVGPNGCGKSNIGDAINWVLGEQSAKMLRGRQMTDVIFAGSAGRKPVGLAEVTLTLGGAAGLLGEDQGRLAITRRLFRSGESEYLINGSRVRLKDIQESLREGKVGARTYATIEQGRIDQVLNAKPKERRALIEDAAGVSGYKHKRRLAEMKLEATEANLLRVNDIVVEVQRQINSLKRQAAKARRYRKLRDDLRDTELTRFAHHARHLEAELEEIRRAEVAARDGEAEAAARLGALEAELVVRRDALEARSLEFREAAERVHRLELEIDRGESTIRACRERIEEAGLTRVRRAEQIEGVRQRQEIVSNVRGEQDDRLERDRTELEGIAERRATAQRELEAAESESRGLRESIEQARRAQFAAVNRAAELRNDLVSIESSIERVSEQRGRLEAEQLQLREDWGRVRDQTSTLAERRQRHADELAALQAGAIEAEAGLDAARRQHDEASQSLARAREREQACQARLGTLEDLATRFAGVSEGVKNLLAAGAAGTLRTRGVVADFLEASQTVESAAEGYLGALLPTVILEDDADTCQAAQLLRRQGAGRTTLLCASQPAGALAVGGSTNGSLAVPVELFEDARVLGRLRDQLRLKASVNGALSERIGDAVLVDSLETALELHRRHPSADYLSQDGDVVYASGVVATGGAAAADRGLLAHRRRTDDARREAESTCAEAQRLQLVVDASREAVVALELAWREARERHDLASRRGVELELQLKSSSEESERSGRRAEVLEAELERLTAELAPMKERLPTLIDEQRSLEESHREHDTALAALIERLETREAALGGLRETVAALRADEAAARQRLEAVVGERERSDEALGELTTRIEALQAELDAAVVLEATNRETQENCERELTAALEQRETQGKAVEQMEREIAAMRESVSAGEAALRDERGAYESVRERTRETELERTRAEAARQHLDELCRQELGLPADEAVALRPPDPDAPQPDLAELELEASSIKEKIERLGPVNMTAIEEFTELEERDAFLTAQRDDLERSMDSLRESIRRINRQSRQRFIEAFDAIRGYYQETYQTLFSGGRADLRLEEGEDVLECGIEILAQPPGKRLTGVHLLSGGEKALSAIALLFAIFRYQPSPFCLLDEVDAALDDSNVGRFAKLVEEYARHTQFILVTHNKLSMEVADLLYGVTMEEPGVSKLMSLQLA